MSWEEREGCLHKHFKFSDFSEAFSFLNRVAKIAEKHGHHPRIENEYNSVDLFLFTHDVGAITQKDKNLAAEIDACFKQ